jgi:hypothetical protein
MPSSVTPMSTAPFAALLAAALLALVPAAQADEQPPIDAIVASPHDGEGNVWDVTRDDLARDHPAVARAVAQPHYVIQVTADEQASTHAFFDAMNTRNATAIRVDGALYSVGITLGQGVPPGSEPLANGPAEEGRNAPAAVAALLGALALAVAVRRRTPPSA